MRETEFIALVNRLEVYERDHPAAYRLRVALLAAVGYLILFGVLGLTLLFVAAVIYGRTLNLLIVAILLSLGILSALIIRSLSVEFEEPEGQELKYDDAPRLFDLLNEIRVALNGPRLHKVLLAPDYNAGIVQRPRLWVFGARNYLRIGLPYLRAISPDDVPALLAHEFGHLSGNHGRFSSWIYRVRQTWIQFLHNTQEYRNDYPMFERFFIWYAPYFEAYTFVLARAREYEADRCSVLVAGKENSARELIKAAIKGRFLADEFWPEIYRRADTQPEPPGETFSEMLQALRDPLPPEKAIPWFCDSLTKRHRYHDTHPELADRLASIGYSDAHNSPELLSFAIADDQPRADQYFLTRPPVEFIQQQNNLWKEKLSERWSARHEFVAEAEQSLAAFVEKAKTTELTIDELWECARLISNKESSIVAMPLLNEVLALKPAHASANFTLGEALLCQGDEAGIKHIEAAMEVDVNAIPGGCELIAEFLTARNRDEEADKYRDCASNYYEEVERARHERENLSTRDTFEPHGLTREALNEFCEQFANYPLLSSAYLVRKVCKHFPEQPGYCLGVVSKRWFGLHLGMRDQKLVSQLSGCINVPGNTFIFPLEGNFKPLRRIFKRIDGAEIYRAS